jgi:hypothetical protein
MHGRLLFIADAILPPDSPPPCLLLRLRSRPTHSVFFSLSETDWLPECLSAWLPECLTAWLTDCLSAWVPECLSAWMSAWDWMGERKFQQPSAIHHSLTHSLLYYLGPRARSSTTHRSIITLNECIYYYILYTIYTIHIDIAKINHVVVEVLVLVPVVTDYHDPWLPW